MKKEVTFIGIFVTLTFLATLILASPNYSLPHMFNGYVNYSQNPEMNLENYEISAKVGAYDLGVVGHVEEDNYYDITVETSGHTGEIKLFIGGAEAEPTIEYEPLKTTNVNLTINKMPINSLCGNNIRETGEQCDGLDLGTGTCENVLGIPQAYGVLSCTSDCTFDYGNCTTPYCGDTICNGDETCSTCSSDCGGCDNNNGGGSHRTSGGGGGSSSSDPIVLNTASDTNESTTNSTNNNQQDSISLLNGSETNDEENTESEKNITEQVFSSLFTGAVIGNSGIDSISEWILVFVILVIIIFLIIRAIRNKAKKRR